jgi:hypothetical protein
MSGRRRYAALLLAVLAGLVALLAGAASSAAAPPYTHKPVISCTPFRPFVGTEITCNGDGYLANDHVIITLHTVTYTLGAVDTDASGSWGDTVLQLPDGVVGPHTVTGTGRGGPKTDSASTKINIRGRGTAGEGTGNGNGNGTGGVSTTGVAVIGMSVLGLGLLIAGTVFVVSARRRRAVV